MHTQVRLSRKICTQAASDLLFQVSLNSGFLSTHAPGSHLFCPGTCTRQMASHKVDSLPVQLTLASPTNSPTLAEPSSCRGSLHLPVLSDLCQTSGLKTSNNHACFQLTPVSHQLRERCSHSVISPGVVFG